MADPTSFDFDDAFFARIIDASPEPYIVVDLEGTIRWVSRTADDLLGDEPGTALGRNMLEFVAAESVDAALAAFGQYTRPDRPDTGFVGPPIPFTLQLGPGREIPAEVHQVPTGDPSFPGMVISFKIRAPETALYRTIERVVADDPIEDVLTSILELIELESPYSVPVIGWSWDGSRFGLSVASPAAPRIDGLALPHDPDGRTPWQLRLGDDVSHTDENLDAIDPALRDAAVAAGVHACWVIPIETAPERPVGAALIVWRRSPGAPMINVARRMDRICGLIRIAFQARNSRAQLRAAARTDSVTGLANRTALWEHLELIRTRRDSAIPDETVVGAIYCDLDRFKDVNDAHGHAVGDKVLVAAAERLRGRIRSGDVVARVGGDEFVIVTTSDSEERIRQLGERVVQAFEDPISVGDVTATLSVSVGVAVMARAELDRPNAGDDLVERADAALLAAKAGGKGRAHHD